jgi:hypothetical protein
MKRRRKIIKQKKLGRMVAPQMDQKRFIPPRKTPKNDGYVYINILKYKRRRVRRQRIAPTRRIRRDKKRRIRRDKKRRIRRKE